MADQALGNTFLEFIDPHSSIYWISHDKEWKQFIKNRANEVRSLISPDSFCPGKDNLADILTQGIAASGQETMNYGGMAPDGLRLVRRTGLKMQIYRKYP